MNIAIKAIDQLREATESGCKFLSFLYQTKGTGEVAKYQINFGIDYREACKNDREALIAYTPQNEVEAEAKEQMLKSLNETIDKGVSSSYTQKDTFVHIGKGLKQHKETGELYIHGFLHNKEQVEPPINPKKVPNSSQLTLTKNKMKKDLSFKRERFAHFILNPSNIGGIKVCGEVVELHP
jgi:hypothetical protein